MGDLISRQAMLDMANGWTYNFCDPEDEWAAMKEIRELPSAEPECNLDEWCHDCKEYDKEKNRCPRWNRVIRTALEEAQPERKTGRWKMEPDPYGFFDEIPVCSECGCTTKMREPYKFCPNCGAKMEQEDRK